MDARRTVETAWRMHSARLVASLTRLVRDLALAEEIADEPIERYSWVREERLVFGRST